MIQSFFTQEDNDGGEPRAKKKKSTTTTLSTNPLPVHKKRNSLDGYDKAGVQEAVKKMRKESSKWRDYESMSIAYTIITRQWNYLDEVYKEWFISPYGMVDSYTKKLENKSGYANATVLSPDLVAVLKIDPKTYDKNKMKVVMSNSGNLGIKEFTHIFCKVCKDKFIPLLLNQYKGKLPEDPKYFELINNWDRLKVKPSLMDLAGCFFPLERHVNAGPNGRRFILRPSEHPPIHTKIKIEGKGHVTESHTSSSSSQSSSTLLSSPDSSQSSIVIDEEDGSMIVQRAPPAKKPDVTTLARGINVKLKKIDTLMDPKINFSTPRRDDIDEWAKEFAIEVVHTGAKKLISNEATLEFYSTVMNGVRGYHNKVVKKFNFPDGKCLPPPPKVALDRNNISKVHSALFESFKFSDSSSNPYNMFKKDSGVFYSIMHDGIQKFSMELNGVILRYVTPDLDVVNLPWKLKEIPGGSLNAEKLVTHLFDVIYTVQQFRYPNTESADEEVSRHLLRRLEATEFSKPPEYFKICRLLDFDDESKEIRLEMICCPVVINGDGCSTNTKAGKDMVKKYGFVSPSLRCTVHAADGSLKRMANSKTMSVEAVVEFLSIFRKVMKHFQLSGKSTDALNDVLAIMGMKKVHMVTFCPTRMAYLLTACGQAVLLLCAICDVLVTLDIKEEQRQYFLSPESMTIMHILADLEPLFKGTFLKILDTDDALIIDSFRINEEFKNKLATNLKFTKLEEFLRNLSEDENGNIILKIKVGDNAQTITLNTSSRPIRRRRGEEDKTKLEIITGRANVLKDEIINNLIENVEDQCQEGTVIEFTSAFDLHRTKSLEERLYYIEQLAAIYVQPSFVQHVEEDDEFWAEYDISIRYPEKIECDVETIKSEFSNIWPVCNRHWKSFSKDENKSDGNRRFWKFMSSNHTITHPHLFRLLDIVFAIAPSTSPLERSYAKFSKICYKDRNKLLPENLEALYLLGILSGKYETMDYGKTMDILES